jgi:hypothetical protein
VGDEKWNLSHGKAKIRARLGQFRGPSLTNPNANQRHKTAWGGQGQLKQAATPWLFFIRPAEVEDFG